MPRLSAVILLLLSLLVLLCPASMAWGSKGHEWTTENAIQLLPDGPLREYMSDSARDLCYLAIVPDFQLRDGEGKPLEGPNHYMDLEILTEHGITPDQLPASWDESARILTEAGISHGDLGRLPWRLQTMYLGLVNAMKTGSRDINMYAGFLAHYAGDATQPLHTTIHYDGRTDREEDGQRFRRGIHHQYETVFVENRNIEFRESSLAMAEPAEELDDVFAEAINVVLAANAEVDTLYDCAEAEWGEDRYEKWEPIIGDMTRQRLADASEFIASLWLSAWIEAGRPELG